MLINNAVDRARTGTRQLAFWHLVASTPNNSSRRGTRFKITGGTPVHGHPRSTPPFGNYLHS